MVLTVKTQYLFPTIDTQLLRTYSPKRCILNENLVVTAPCYVFHDGELCDCEHGEGSRIHKM